MRSATVERSARTPLSVPGARVARTGMGPDRADQAARSALRSFSGPVAVAGFCGALTDELAPGDVVVASEVQTADGKVFACSSAPLAAALRGLGLARVRVGPIVSTDHVVRDGERAGMARDGAIAVDMESASFARAAIGAGRPFAVVRVVVDSPGHELALRRPQTWFTGGLAAYRALRRSAPSGEPLRTRRFRSSALPKKAMGFSARAGRYRSSSP